MSTSFLFRRDAAFSGAEDDTGMGSLHELIALHREIEASPAVALASLCAQAITRAIASVRERIRAYVSLLCLPSDMGVTIFVFLPFRLIVDAATRLHWFASGTGAFDQCAAVMHSYLCFPFSTIPKSLYASRTT